MENTAWMLDASAIELAHAIDIGKITARQAVEAHIDQLRARPELRAIAQDRYTEALAEADAADMSTDRDLPLLGVPFTVKESIPVAGMPHTAGLASRRGITSMVDAIPVHRLRAAGAIPVAVTNTAELCLGIESVNPVYGRTSNPYDIKRTAGGSSGGEGAAVGSGGVPFGLGADTGGSIRIPAFFCGVFGHKPTPGIVPSAEQIPSLTKVSGIESDPTETIGPITRRAEDLMPLLRIIAGNPHLPGPEDVDLVGLRVVIPDDSTYFRPVSKELRDAQEKAANVLAQAGAVVTHVSLKGLRRGVQHYLIELRDHAGTPVANLFDLYASRPPRGPLPSWLRANSTQLKLAIIGDRLPGLLPESAREKVRVAGRSLAEQITDVIGDGVMLHPPFPRTAPLHNATLGRPWLFGGAAVFNLVGLPVTQVPLGLSKHGLPLGVQVAAAAGNDHVCIKVALELEERASKNRPVLSDRRTGRRIGF